MPIQFPTEAWVKALMAELNQSAGYREAAKNWEGDFYFVVNAGPGIPRDMFLYMDLWHGECRAAYAVEDPAAKSPEFAIEAPLPIWRKVIEKKLDPIQGLVTRQLKLKGNLVKIMRVPKAAFELVNCCTRIETAWPEVPA
jgi:putative sterol carrier protein